MIATQVHLQSVTEELRQASKHLSKNVIVAPLNGVIVQRNINVGDLASDGTTGPPLFRIVDNRILTITATVPAATMAMLAVGQALRFTTESLPGQEFHGKILYINSEVNTADRSVKVKAEVQNSVEALKGGMFVKGRIVTSERPATIFVPRIALSTWDTMAGTAKLFIVAEGTARLREVQTGATLDDKVEIVKGISVGEQYITRGGFTVKDGDRVHSTAGPVGKDKG